MALERVPADIRKEGGVARMCSIEVIEGIQRSVSIPVMAKVRIGHFLEARVLESLGVDFIDESEVLTPADEEHHIDKVGFRSPFVCGARNLGEALRRVSEGAAMIRTKGEAGSGNIVEAVRHLRHVTGEIRALAALRGDELGGRAKELQAPLDLVRRVAERGRLPVPNFAAGGIATPADASLCMALGAEAVFVGSGIFKSADPAARARAIVRATTHWDEPEEVLAASRGLGRAMEGIEMEQLAEHERLANRGW
jgi:pyridoxal 5'-phosphate synthase pdxS subunit